MKKELRASQHALRYCGALVSKLRLARLRFQSVTASDTTPKSKDTMKNHLELRLHTTWSLTVLEAVRWILVRPSQPIASVTHDEMSAARNRRAPGTRLQRRASRATAKLISQTADAITTRMVKGMSFIYHDKQSAHITKTVRVWTGTACGAKATQN